MPHSGQYLPATTHVVCFLTKQVGPFLPGTGSSCVLFPGSSCIPAIIKYVKPNKQNNAKITIKHMNAKSVFKAFIHVFAPNNPVDAQHAIIMFGVYII